jgi:hypothetical protein
MSEHDELLTVRWVATNGDYVEADFTPKHAARFQQGKSAMFAGPPRRYDGRLAIAGLKARQDQIDSRLDELVTKYPQLKSR